jgi:hypothetical protein
MYHLCGCFVGGVGQVSTAHVSLHRTAGPLLDLREVFTHLLETWQTSARPGECTLLPEALPPLLLAVDATGQQQLLDTARLLVDKVLPRALSCLA